MSSVSTLLQWQQKLRLDLVQDVEFIAPPLLWHWCLSLRRASLLSLE
jgi:hypothetical protein